MTKNEVGCVTDRDCEDNLRCIKSSNNTKYRFSILFVVKPEKAKKSDIILPYYIAILDDQKNLVHLTQLYLSRR